MNNQLIFKEQILYLIIFFILLINSQWNLLNNIVSSINLSKSIFT